MNRKDIYTLLVLGILTLSTAFFSNTNGIKYVALIILSLSGFKFLLVAFQFMELKKANALWKVLLSVLLLIFVVTITSILL